MINQFRCCTDKTKSSSMILGREINQKIFGAKIIKQSICMRMVKNINRIQIHYYLCRFVINIPKKPKTNYY